MIPRGMCSKHCVISNFIYFADLILCNIQPVPPTIGGTIVSHYIFTYG